MKEITLVNPWDTENTKPLKEVTLIFIHPDYPDRHVLIETELNEELQNALVEFLKEKYDVFSWSQGDVPGIDPQIVVYKVFIDHNHPLVCQKRRKFALEHLKVIEEDVAKLIKANVIIESHYPDWLANVIVTPKKGENGEYVFILPTWTKLAPKTVFIYKRLI